MKTTKKIDKIIERVVDLILILPYILGFIFLIGLISIIWINNIEIQFLIAKIICTDIVLLGVSIWLRNVVKIKLNEY